MKAFLYDRDFDVATLKELKNCSICPRNCHKNRFSDDLGYCNTDTSFNISSVTLHHGEEPVISGTKGICNVFFAHCNLQCSFCQNYQISNNKAGIEVEQSLEQILLRITKLINQGAHAVGFVSPSHMIPQLKIIIHALRKNRYSPAIVYNTNAYDKPETIAGLQELISVYLPDYKYADKDLAARYSGAANYPETALKAIREMYRQKGSTMITSDEGIAESGLIIRHLVLPGHTANSFGVLENIAEHISPNVHISLMSQYYPTLHVSKVSPLNRKVYLEEYLKVIKHMEMLGMLKGWIQEPESSSGFIPDFNKTNPFE